MFDAKKDGDLDLKELLRGLGLIAHRRTETTLGGEWASVLR